MYRTDFMQTAVATNLWLLSIYVLHIAYSVAPLSESEHVFPGDAQVMLLSLLTERQEHFWSEEDALHTSKSVAELCTQTPR